MVSPGFARGYLFGIIAAADAAVVARAALVVDADLDLDALARRRRPRSPPTPAPFSSALAADACVADAARAVLFDADAALDACRVADALVGPALPGASPPSPSGIAAAHGRVAPHDHGRHAPHAAATHEARVPAARVRPLLAVLVPFSAVRCDAGRRICRIVPVVHVY